MEQLSQMKQRIKAVETIKKVTHAMRLISMATHTKLKDNRAFLTAYKQAFISLWASVTHALPPLEDKRPRDSHHLIILVGSQKGLVGTLNTNLFKQLEKEHSSFEHCYFIGIGKQAVDYLNTKKATTLAIYDTLTAEDFVVIAQSVTTLLINSPVQYASTTIYSNIAKSFFVQLPTKTNLLPLVEPQVSASTSRIDYSFDQPPEVLQATLIELLLSVTLQEALYDAILAEQAARFVSMDSSTRNADNLLASMKLDYNKVRQASITRELTELTATL